MVNKFRVNNGIISGGPIVPDANDSYDYYLRMEGDILMTDASKIATAAGDFTIDATGSDIRLKTAVTVSHSLVDLMEDLT